MSRSFDITLIAGMHAYCIYASRGVRCSADPIIIGAGTQVLIGLLSMCIGKEHIYALENPGFHRTRITLQDLGVSTVPIPLDEDGINISQLKKNGCKCCICNTVSSISLWNDNAHFT